MKENSVLNKLRNRGGAFTHDILAIPVAWFLAYFLRFNLEFPSPFVMVVAENALAILIPAQAFVFWRLGLYRGVWRFASIPDLQRIIKCVIFGVGLSMLILFAFTRLAEIPRSVPLLYGVILLGILAGSRLLYRWYKDYDIYKKAGEHILIVGAGRAGEMLVRELLQDIKHAYQPIVFVDDDKSKWGRDIHGVRVLGGSSSIVEFVDRLAIDKIFIAIPSASSQQMQKIVEFCEQSEKPFRTLPRFRDITTGSLHIDDLRPVSIEDLLGREPVSLDWGSIKNGLTNKVILVSGGGGSIGSELCRQVACLEPKSLIVFERSEYNLYRIDKELRETFPHLNIKSHLGDVCENSTVDHLLCETKPNVIFHAAAYKHVPILQDSIREAMHNNVIGTQVMAELADKHECEQFILISSDKAVNPANYMGTSKRIAEIYCQNINARSATCYVTVRFGNVLDSAGSVVPLFREQILKGGPVTVTHPDVTRYFMTISESCQLIMQASVMGHGGEIYVLNMGNPVKINYLAEQMIRLSGKEVGKDIEITYTGLRPGEKLYEELFHESENLSETKISNILLANHRKVDWSLIGTALNELKNACDFHDTQSLIVVAKRMVPELVDKLDVVNANVVPLINRSTA